MRHFTIAAPNRRRGWQFFLPLAAAVACCAAAPRARKGIRFGLSIPAALQKRALNGRIYLLISSAPKPEPRFLINDSPRTQQIFGQQVRQLRPGQTVWLKASALGYPRRRLSQIPPGRYYVQALLNVYATFHLAHGRTLRLPPERGEGQQWNRKPGNFYSRPRRLRLDAARGGIIRLSLDRRIPPIARPASRGRLRYLRYQDARLSRFWGRPVYLGAYVLLPAGWHRHAAARYPLIVYQGHFSHGFRVPIAYRRRPPAAKTRGVKRAYEQSSYNFRQAWLVGKLPHVLLVMIQHANPYYDDSYSVNSANLGPYGDAIVKDLIPYIERRYRGIGQGWARALYGGSTGGWETLATQIFYPDDFNGAWGACPDPVDFRSFQIVNLYKNKNAYWRMGPWSRVARPSIRKPSGLITTTMPRELRRERVLGSKGRSTRQFDIWQAVFSPAGANGYPAPIWNARTGAIHPRVAAYWKTHYDLRAWLKAHWATLGPRLHGKLHVTVGDMDTYYLNNAVHRLQNFLAHSRSPHVAGDFQYGPGLPHCFFGGNPKLPVWQTAFQAPLRIIPILVRHMLASAPAGADTHSWRY